MKKNEIITEENGIKTRMAVWLYPETWELAERMVLQDNCKSKSEYIERAVQFYAGYVSSQDSTEFLVPTLVSAMGGTIHDSENRIARLLFKQAVELSMLTQVVASKLNISNVDLRELRRECVDAVKRSNGSLDLEKTAREKQGL